MKTTLNSPCLRAICAVLIASALPVAAQVVHDAAADFSITNGNPNGVWSYGTYHNTTHVFEPYAFGSVHPTTNLPVWRTTSDPSTQPSVVLNPGPGVFQNADTRLNPGEIFLHPSTSNSSVGSAIRFTAPATKIYRLQGEFFGTNHPTGAIIRCIIRKPGTGGASSEVLLDRIHNATLLQAGSRTGPGTGIAFDQRLLMKAGEVVHFVVDSNQGPNNDSSGMLLTVTETTDTLPVQASYDATAEFSIAHGNTNGVWTYGSLTASGTDFVRHDVARSDAGTLGLSLWGRSSGTNIFLPCIARNDTGSAIIDPVIRMGPGELMLHPTTTSPNYSVLHPSMRFTAPEAGIYRLSGSFWNSSNLGASVTLILRKGTVILHERKFEWRRGTPVPTGVTTGIPFEVTVALNQGESVDTSISDGSDSNGADQDPTGLALTVEAVAPPAATDHRWLGGTGNWSDTAKWNLGIVPINDQPTAGALYNATSDTNPNNAGTNITVDVPVVVDGLTLGIRENVGFGTFSVVGPETLTIDKRFRWHKGALALSNAGNGLVFGPDSEVEIAGNNSMSLTATRLLNHGVVTIEKGFLNGVALTPDQQMLSLNQSGTPAVRTVITNEGTIEIRDHVDIVGSGADIINNGTFIKSGAEGEESYIHHTHLFTNNGLVQVDGGILNLLTSGTHQGTYQLAAGAELRFNGTHNFAGASETNGAGTLAVTGGTTTANAPVTFNSPTRIAAQFVANDVVDFHGKITLEATGNNVGVTGPAESRFHGQMDWLSGWFHGTGTTRFAAGAVAEVKGTGAKAVDVGRRLINERTLSHSGAAIGIAGVLENRGTLVLNGANGTSTNGTGSGRNLENTATGIIRKAAPPEGQPVVAETLLQADAFINSGKVEVESGTLKLNTAGTHTSAQLVIEENARLLLERSHSFDADTTFTGDGELQISASTVFDENTIDVPSVFQTGILTGPGVTFDRDVVWSGGRMHGPGTTIFEAGTSVSFVAGGGDFKLLDHGRVLRSKGQITMNHAFGLAGSSRIENEGQFTVNGAVNFGNNSGTIVNMSTGTFTKNGAAGEQTLTGGIGFENSGRVEVNGGTMYFNGTYVQNSGALVLNGGNVAKDNAAMAINGGSVQGAGTITGAVAVSGGTVAPGIDAVPGALTITGNLTLTSTSKLSFDVGGTTPGTEHDLITEAGSTALNLNGATLELGHLDGYTAGTVTILSSNAAITGSFGNVAHLGRIKTKDGKGTFRVSYPAGSTSVQIDSFLPAPYELLLGGNAEITENQPQGTLVGTLSASHILPDPSLAFTLVSGEGSTDNASFRIVGNQLQVQTPLDFENGGGSRSVRVRVTDLDNGEFIEDVFAITVLDVPSPASLALSNASVVENQPAGTEVGQLSALPGEQAPFTFALVPGAGSTDNARFSVDGGTLKIAAPLDFEATPGPFTIRVQVTNAGGETLEQVFSNLVVEDVPSPVGLQFTGQSIAENTPAGTPVGTLSATDALPLTFSLVAGDGDADNARFEIAGNQLQRSGEPLDFETQTVASVRVRVTNEGGETLEGVYVIQVLNVGPSGLALSHLTMPENQPINTVVGAFSVPGAAPEENFTYTLTDTANFPNNSFFNITDDQLQTGVVFDFDDPHALKTFDVRVRVTDAAGEPKDESFTITLTNTGPTDIILTPATVAENLPAGTVIGQLSATLVPDDPMASPVFSFVDVAPGTPVAFGPDNRSLVTTRPLSFAAEPSITVRVRAVHLGEEFEEDLTIEVTENPALLRVDHPFNTNLGTGSGTLALGDIPLDSAANTDVFLRNDGPAHIFNLRIQNPAAPGDEALVTSGDLPGDLAPGETIFVQVLFRPAAIGLRSSVITFQSDNAPDYPLTVTANGLAPNLAITDYSGAAVPASGSFVDLGLGLLAPDVLSRSFTLQNAGNAPLEGLSASLIGAESTVFSLVPESLPFTLAPGASTTLTVNYTPLAEGIESPVLRIVSNDPDSPTFSIVLKAQGVTPVQLAQTAYAKAGDPRQSASFGTSVAIDGDTALVGAPGAFAAYVLVRSPETGAWRQQQRLGAFGSSSFGSVVALSGDTAACLRKSTGTGLRSVMVFVRSGETWTLQQQITQPGAAQDGFGFSLDLEGDRLVVGAPGDASNATGVNGDPADSSAHDSGAAYIFERSGTVWSQVAYLKASNTGSGDQFGRSVALSGDTVVVGANFEDGGNAGVNPDGADNSAESSGAAYVFVHEAGVWSQQAYLKASNTDPSDFFGNAVAIDGTTIVVSAQGEDGKFPGVNGAQDSNVSTSSGAAYVFVQDGSGWRQQAYLKASNPDSFDFLTAVAISGDMIVVGAAGEDSRSTGINGLQNDNFAGFSGAAYVFRRAADQWTQHAYLKASNTDAGDGFGGSVAVSGGRVLVGARLENSASGGINGDGSDNNLLDSGAAYIFEVIPPEVIVHAGADTSAPRLADNQAVPVDFGNTLPGQAVTRAFTIVNARRLPLAVFGINVPAGYSVVEAPTAIPAQGRATFFVRLTAAAAGSFAGSVDISTDATENLLFTFPVTGEVTSPPPGTLDPRFGGGTGIVRADFLGQDDRAYAMVVMPDGKIVLGGGSGIADGSDSGRLARFHPDGSLDTGFGEEGRFSYISPGAVSREITCLAIQDGKLLAAMHPQNHNTGDLDGYAGLIRCLPDGSVDPSFVPFTRFATDPSWRATITAMQTTDSGKILLAGSIYSNSTLIPYVRRLNQIGMPDQGFAGSASGIAGLPTNTNIDSVGESLLLTPGGDIIIGGMNGSLPHGRMTLWKLDQQGLNPSRLVMPASPFGGAFDEESISGVALQPNGSVVFAGRKQAAYNLRGPANGFHAGRTTPSFALDATSNDLNPATFLDASFNGTGLSFNDLNPATADERANSVAVQPDGKIVVAGSLDGKLAVMRFRTNGSPDSSFGTDGLVLIDAGPNGAAYKVIVLPDSDILVAGHAENPLNPSAGQDFVLVKILGHVMREPNMVVRDVSSPGEPVITHGQATAVTFGTPRVGAVTQRLFRIENTGTGDLQIDSISLPPGYRVLDRPASVAAGSAREFGIELHSETAGVFAGSVTLMTNDASHGTFTFPVTGTVQPNLPPAFDGFTASTVQAQSVDISIEKLIKAVHDANGDVVQLTSFSEASVGGGTIGLRDSSGSSVLLYKPAPNFVGTDRFSVVFSDGEAEIAGVVNVQVTADPAFNPRNPPVLLPQGGAGLSVSFSGIPRRFYNIERSTNLVNWDVIAKVKSSSTGKVTYTDPVPPQPSAFYRISTVPRD